MSAASPLPPDSSHWWTLLLLPESYNDRSPVCMDTNCAILPLGYLLLTSDICFDLQYLLAPSAASAQRLIQYYQFILTPRWTCPGYYFPLYVIFQLCVKCPSIHNFITLSLWLPIAYRYVAIMKQQLTSSSSSSSSSGGNNNNSNNSNSNSNNSSECDDLLRNHGSLLHNWWTVVVLRLALYYINYSNLQASQCGISSAEEWMPWIQKFVLGQAL